MPKPVSPRATYLPGLDGLRALAVIAVVGYHLGVPHMSGGLLGVGVFFTLSGFLITRILTELFARTGSVRVREFWVSRARRLLPALLVMLGVVLATTAVVDHKHLVAWWRQSLAAMVYIANWATISRKVSYFDRFSGPSPVDHLWSLSIEEQFYVLWPVLLAFGLGLFRWSARRAAAATAALGAVSFVLLAVLAHPGFDHTRAYEGTDTRAGGILLGAALALIWPEMAAAANASARARRGIEAGGVLGLTGIGWLVATTDDYSLAMYRGGLLVLTVCTVAVLAALAQHGSVLGRALGLGPLRWVGERSYGIYLWHLPVVVFAPLPAGQRQGWLRGGVLVAITLVLAELSWRLVENPVRQHGLRGALRDLGRFVPSIRRLPAMPRLVVGVLAVFTSGTCLLSACSLVTRVWDVAAASTPRPTAAARIVSPRSLARSTVTSCTEVVHVGDSTSLGLVSADYLPAVSDQLPARLEHVGVRSVQTDIYGARSIVETYDGQPNATDAVTTRMNAGYDGCWTIAMGINEAANQAVGGVYPFDQRIDRLMRPIGNHPVLWLTVRTLRSGDAYADTGMKAFSDALVAACARYPNLRVYDWRAEVNSSWFIDDGIHYTPLGYRERAQRIAAALAIAFPKDEPPPDGCVVRTSHG